MFQQAGIMPIYVHPLRNTVAGEITKGGNDLCREKKMMADIEEVVYMYQYLYHIDLFRSHASSKPH